MGVLDLFKKADRPALAGASPRRKRDDDLFDDEFQRKLDYLALVSRRVFSGRDARRAPDEEDGQRRRVRRPPRLPAGRRLPLPRLERLPALRSAAHPPLRGGGGPRASTSSSTPRASMGFGDGEKLQARPSGLAAALAYVGLANLDRVAHRDGERRDHGAHADDARQGAHLPASSASCASVEADGHTDLGDAMKTFVAQHKRRGLAVLHQRSLRPGRLRARHQRAPLQQVRALRRPRRRPARGASRSSRGDVLVYDCETGDEREVTVTAKVLERFARGLRGVPRRGRALLHHAPGRLLPRRRRRPVRRADPARLPARRVPPLARHALRRPPARHARSRSAPLAGAAVVVLYILKLRRRVGRGAVLAALAAHPPRQGGDEPLLEAQAAPLAPAPARAPRAARCSRSAIRARRRTLIKGRNVVVLVDASASMQATDVVAEPPRRREGAR